MGAIWPLEIRGGCGKVLGMDFLENCMSALYTFFVWVLYIASGLGALACLFTVLASIVHFQILGAMGFAILGFGLFVFWGWISTKF